MARRPHCAIEGCNNEALILFNGQWICGEHLAKYDRKLKEEQFNKFQEMVKDGN